MFSSAPVCGNISGAQQLRERTGLRLSHPGMRCPVFSEEDEYENQSSPCHSGTCALGSCPGRRGSRLRLGCHTEREGGLLRFQRMRGEGQSRQQGCRARARQHVLQRHRRSAGPGRGRQVVEEGRGAGRCGITAQSRPGVHGRKMPMPREHSATCIYPVKA